MTRATALRRQLITALCVVGVFSHAWAAEPSLEGVWKLASSSGQLVPVDGEPVPFTEPGRMAYAANKAAAARNDYSFDPTSTGCASPGQPRLMLSPESFVVFQRPRMVTILYAWNRLFRQINVGKPLKNPLLPATYADFPTRQGYAEGRWEANTLVVKTTGFSEEKLLDDFLPNSDQLELSERIRLRSPELLEDRITIKDPKMYRRAWDALLTYRRQADNEFPFAEDVCLDRLAAKQPPLRR